MSTREDKKASHPNAVDLGLEGSNFPSDIEIPPCTIEDVDRSLFNLLDKQLPFQYNHKGQQKKVPVIFATGERFAVLRRKEPLRDKSGALVLPLISLMRTGIAQDSTPSSGPHHRGPITIRRKIDKSSSIYKRLVNIEGFENSDDHTHPSNVMPASGTFPGAIASRQKKAPVAGFGVKGMPTTDFTENVYETIVMPSIKYFTSSYEVTFWCQYTTQMNDMITAMMSMYQDNNKRTFRLETDKGYWFVAYVGSEFSPQENFDDFSDDERLVKYSFTVTVNGYQIAPEFPGSPVFLRRFISATHISFETEDNVPTPVPIDDPLPGQAIGGTGLASSRAVSGDQVSGAAYSGAGTKGISTPGNIPATESVGGTSAGSVNDSVVTYEIHPITGERVRVYTKRVTRNSRRGETVHKVLNPSSFGSFNNE
jgi:hypothetical protein